MRLCRLKEEPRRKIVQTYCHTEARVVFDVRLSCKIVDGRHRPSTRWSVTPASQFLCQQKMHRCVEQLHNMPVFFLYVILQDLHTLQKLTHQFVVILLITKGRGGGND